MDLSSNDISDVGVEALSSCLMRGGGQDMIELDLRGNRDVGVGGDNGGVLEALKRERRVLNVLVGKVVKEEVIPIEVVGTVKKKETTTTSGLPIQTTTTTTTRQEQYSDIVQNIFQMAGEDDDDDEDEDDSDDEGAGLDGMYLNPEEESERLWAEVRR